MSNLEQSKQRQIQIDRDIETDKEKERADYQRYIKWIGYKNCKNSYFICKVNHLQSL